jgi:hypothetical protein
MDVDIVAEAIREAEAATIAPRFRTLTDDDVTFKGPDDPGPSPIVPAKRCSVPRSG